MNQVLCDASTYYWVKKKKRWIPAIQPEDRIDLPTRKFQTSYLCNNSHNPVQNSILSTVVWPALLVLKERKNVAVCQAAVSQPFLEDTNHHQRTLVKLQIQSSRTLHDLDSQLGWLVMHSQLFL